MCHTDRFVSVHLANDSERRLTGSKSILRSSTMIRISRMIFCGDVLGVAMLAERGF